MTIFYLYRNISLKMYKDLTTYLEMDFMRRVLINS